MEKKVKASKSKSAKGVASNARLQMIKEAALKFANKNKAKSVAAKPKKLSAAPKKKKPKGRIGIPLRKDRQARRDQAALLAAPLPTPTI